MAVNDRSASANTLDTNAPANDRTRSSIVDAVQEVVVFTGDRFLWRRISDVLDEADT